MNPELLVDQQHLDAIAAHARFCLPNEACGLVATDGDGAVTMIYCLTNLDASPYRFTVDPSEHFAAWRHARARGWEIAGSFHSHPDSPAAPSATDVDGALDPSWFYLIAGPVGSGPTDIRAYRITEGSASEVPLRTRRRDRSE